jgi:hypothetical protein
VSQAGFTSRIALLSGVTAITNDRSILIPKKPGRQPRVKTNDSNSSFAIEDGCDVEMIA